MAERMSQEVKEKALRGWLQGKTRDEIAIEAQISSGSVTNIIKSWLKGLNSTEYSAARDLAVTIQKIWNESKGMCRSTQAQKPAKM